MTFRASFVCACLLAAAGLSHGQEPGAPSERNERPRPWILQIRSEADFDFADNSAAVHAATALLASDHDLPRDVRAAALRVLFHDAYYANRSKDAAAFLVRLRDVCPDDPEAAVRTVQQAGFSTADDFALRIRELEGLVRQAPHYTPALYTLTNLLVESGRAQDAWPHFDSTDRDTSDALLLTSRAAVLQARGEYRKSLETLDASLACEPQIRFVDVQYLARAEALCAVNRPDAALAFCALTVHLKPPHKDAQVYLWKTSRLAARCYQLLGKTELAYFCAKLQVKSAPQLAESWLALADTAVCSGRYEEAKRSLDTLTKLAPPSARAACLAARAARGAGDEAGALAAARDGLRAFPADPDLRRFECLLLATATSTDIRNPKKAADLAAAALAGPDGRFPEWLYCAAVADAACGDYTAATEFIARAGSAAGGSSPALRQSLQAARELFEKKQPVVERARPAIADDGDAIRPRPEWIDEITSDWDYDLLPVDVVTEHCRKALVNEGLVPALRIKAAEVLAHLSRRQGQTADARQAFAALVGAVPGNLDYRRESLSLEVLSMPPQGRANAWERFCSDFPKDTEGRAQWALAVFRSGDAARALDIMAPAERDTPDHPRVLHLAALVAFSRGNYEPCIRLVNRWLCAPDRRDLHALAYLMRAEALARLRRFDEALSNLAVVHRLAAEPTFRAQVYRLAARVYLEQDKPTLSLQVANRWEATGLGRAEALLAVATAGQIGGDEATVQAALDRLPPSASGSAQAALVETFSRVRRGDHVPARDLLARRVADDPRDDPRSEATACALAMHLTFALDDHVRDGNRALELAKARVGRGSTLNGVWAVCLANAYAETGDFDKATSVIEAHGRDVDKAKVDAIRRAYASKASLRYGSEVSEWVQRQLLLASTGSR
jgi:tetratricopeptide (TPR) repeat protein